MKNTIYNYVELRGDLTIDQYPYNEIDYLIFSELSYVCFDHILNSDVHDALTLEQAYELYKNEHKNDSQDENVSYYKSLKLLKKMAYLPRYRHIKLLSYVNDVDKDLIKQFAALTLLLENQTLCIAYRGTDDSLVGWHEDFLMLCDDVVPAQKSSVKYLDYISQYEYTDSLCDDLKCKYLGKNIWERLKKHFQYKKNRPIILVGHSKGGNLAMYAGCMATQEIQNRISHIYNYDGPGFHEQMMNSSQYQKMLPRIQSYIPHYSFFGITLGHEEQYQVVHSYHTGMIQHDATSWQVNAMGFVGDELSYESVQFAINVLLFLDKLTLEEKYIFIDTMFGLFDSLGILTFSDLAHISFKQIIYAIKEMTLLESSVRKMLIEVLHMLWIESKKSKENES